MQQILGNDHPDTLNAMNNLALMLRDQGKLPEAVAMLQDALGEDEAGSGQQPSRYSQRHEQGPPLALMLGDQGKLPEAAAMKTEVLQKMQQILGDNHPGYSRCYEQPCVDVQRSRKASRGSGDSDGGTRKDAANPWQRPSRYSHYH